MAEGQKTNKMLENIDVKNPGVWIWRVDSFRLVEIPKPSHGTFFSGDSYVVLHTFPTESGIKHRIYAWQGRDSSPDEKASSAILGQKLDNEELGGMAEQVREVQHEESDEFRKLFAGGLNFKAGGVPSGFRHAEQAASKQNEAHLFAVISPSRTSIQVVEVEPRLSSMRSNGSFVLDAPGRKTLFVWHGDAANLREKSKSLEVANTFRSNRGSMRLTVLDQADTDSDDARAFFQLLQEPSPEGAAKSIGPSDQALPCLSAAAAAPEGDGGGALGAPRLFKLVEGGAPREVPGPPSRSSLSADAQFGLVVNGRVFVWSGSKAPPCTREQGLMLVKAAGLPETAPVELVKDHLEPGAFMVHFPDWNDAQFARFQAYQASKALPDSYGAVSSPKHHRDQPHGMQFDAEDVARQMVRDAQSAPQSAPHPRAATPSSGLGTDGKQTVWVVRSSELVELPQNERGHFFDGDAYVVLYEYMLHGEARQMIYFWIGRHCSNHEKGAAALLATDMFNNKFKGTAALCRVAQNAEPGHFAAVFGGALCIHSGERPAQGGLPGGVRLYKVKAENAESVHAVEVELKASSLNSGDCFVLKEPSVSEGGNQGRVLLWQGQGSSAEEVETASRVAHTLAGASATVVHLKEGEEPSAFWRLLGGMAEYPRDSSKAATHRTPLLFHIRDTAGPNGVKVEVSATFNQDSLAATDAMILDPGNSGELYVWCGRDASALERPRAHTLAEAYARVQGQHQVNLVDVAAGAEPPFFTQHFVAWDPTKRSSIPDVYQEKLQRQQQEKERAAEK